MHVTCHTNVHVPCSFTDVAAFICCGHSVVCTSVDNVCAFILTFTIISLPCMLISKSNNLQKFGKIHTMAIYYIDQEMEESM